jgi:hypothetical protein
MIRMLVATYRPVGQPLLLGPDAGNNQRRSESDSWSENEVASGAHFGGDQTITISATGGDLALARSGGLA